MRRAASWIVIALALGWLVLFLSSSRLLKMQLKWHWLRVGVVYEFKALPTLPFGSLLSFKRLLRSTWAT